LLSVVDCVHLSAIDALPPVVDAIPARGLALYSSENVAPLKQQQQPEQSNVVRHDDFAMLVIVGRRGARAAHSVRTRDSIVSASERTNKRKSNRRHRPALFAFELLFGEQAFQIERQLVREIELDHVRRRSATGILKWNKNRRSSYECECKRIQ
jgi:hypothetical protein